MSKTFQKKRRASRKPNSAGACESRTFTQVEAVEFFPFELRTLQAYEAGDSSPVLEDARIMAKVYHCRIDELVGDETT